MHAHSDYSDGDMDNTCNGARQHDLLLQHRADRRSTSISWASRTTITTKVGDDAAKYASGLSEATAYTAANRPFHRLLRHGFGTISTGGHVTIYGINQLLGWNTGNYNVYVAKVATTPCSTWWLPTWRVYHAVSPEQYRFR